jgi:hypothetical protein
MTERMKRCRLQVTPGRKEPASPLWTGRRELHLHLIRGAVGIKYPDIPTAVIGDASTVCGGESGVEVLMVGVASYVPTGRSDRVDIAHTFMVGEIEDPSPNPHRVG